MIKVFNTGEIQTNIKTEIKYVNGEILKIVAMCSDALKNVKIKITTNDDETLCEDYVQDIFTKFYPKNTITISQEFMHLDNYFVAGSLYLEIEGLGDNEKIENIAIYYK